MPAGEDGTQNAEDVPLTPRDRMIAALEGMRRILFESGVGTMHRTIDETSCLTEKSYVLLAFVSAIDMARRREEGVQELKKTLAEKYEELPFHDQSGTVEQESITAASTGPESYKYPPLDSHPSAIRLVVLRPSLEWHEDIVCDFHNIVLDESTREYEALSYVWGDPARRRPVIVGDQLFQATENLEIALRNLRHHTEPRVLWIDAICINQNNIAERNEQVQLMGHIYQCAQRVVVWLGPESDASGAAFRVMNDIFAQDFPDPTSPTCEDFWAAFLPGIPAFLRLLKRPWFTRVWCIQELGLARVGIFQCGQLSTEMANFLWMNRMVSTTAVKRLELICTIPDMLSAETARPLNKLLRLHSRLLTTAVTGVGPDPDSSDSVLDLLEQFQDWLCSNDKDRVFAFYGLVPAGSPDRAALCPNYSLSVAQIYTRFAVRYLQEHKDLRILLTATRPVADFVDISAERGLPSWVPDWRDPSKHGACHVYWTIGIHTLQMHGQTPRSIMYDNMYDACLGLQASPLGFRNNFKTLCLDGIMVDKIVDIGLVHFGQYLNHEQALEVRREWRQIAAVSTDYSYPYTGEPSSEAFWRTLVMDIDITNLSTKESLLLSPDRWLEDVLRRRRIPPKTSGLPLAEQDEGQPTDALVYIFGPMEGRRLFRTAKGLIGLGPASAQNDDEVAVIFGSRAPFVLRPDGESHRVMGECYVHGIMDGEAIHRPRRREFADLSDKEFHII